MSAESGAMKETGASIGVSRADLMTLTKARLSLMVVITTSVGYLTAVRGHDFQIWTLIHTLIGTSLAAFAAAVFNQLMEIEHDARMARTADRPLPGKRISPVGAFVIGWVLAAVGIVHLLMKVNLLAAQLAAITIALYIFVYTPLKRRSAQNTVVGAVVGAIPPLIGWVAGKQGLLTGEAFFHFALLFLWQMPHFIALCYMYREEYEKGGFVMWSKGDLDGRRTSLLALVFSMALLLLGFMPPFLECVKTWFYLWPSLLLNGLMMQRAWAFYRKKDQKTAKSLFLYTLLYLPLFLLLLLLTWKPNS